MHWSTYWMSTFFTQLMNKKAKFYDLSCLPSHAQKMQFQNVYFSLPLLIKLTQFSAQTELVPLTAHMLLVLLLEEFTLFDPSERGKSTLLARGLLQRWSCSTCSRMLHPAVCLLQPCVGAMKLTRMESAGSGKNCIFKRQWWLLIWKREEISH